MSPASLQRFWLARPIRRESFINICQAVEVNWELVADALPPDAKTTATRGFQPATIDWRSVASEMLSERKRLTTNPLTKADGRTFELDDIYVPVGLVARSQRARLGEDVPPSEGSRLYHPEREEGVLDTAHLEFLLSESQGRRLAIIGEPGTGKTTLLQKIAFWLLASTPDIPIWISLADLQGKSLEAYLLEDWLKTATRKIRVTEELQDSLGELFNSGRVWLLLDGLDEMVADGTGPLGAIAPQFTGWIASARIVLSCRLNIWDGGKNPLEEFETYRTLDFSSGDGRKTPDRIGQFIERWFHSQPELGDSLRRELDQPGHRGLRDMVKNPLRLTLLCRTWGRWNGKLPGSKAELYQQFAEALYDWKQEIFPTTSDGRQELNEALGRLAYRALTEEKIKFRLRHRLVCDVLGEPDGLLYNLALNLGWLNVVGIAAENPDEPVYAFWHPVFQEYFAELDKGYGDIFEKFESEEADYDLLMLYIDEWLEDRAHSRTAKDLLYYIKDDPEGLFSKKHIQDRPEANFQALFLRRVAGDTWKKISEDWGIRLPALTKFYSQCCKQFASKVKFELKVHIN